MIWRAPELGSTSGGARLPGLRCCDRDEAVLAWNASDEHPAPVRLRYLRVPAQRKRKLPSQVNRSFEDRADESLGRNVSGGFRPRLS